MTVRVVTAASYVVVCDRCKTKTPPHEQRPPGWCSFDAHVLVAGAGSDWVHLELCPTCLGIVTRTISAR